MFLLTSQASIDGINQMARTQETILKHVFTTSSNSKQILTLDGDKASYNMNHSRNCPEIYHITPIHTLPLHMKYPDVDPEYLQKLNTQNLRWL